MPLVNENALILGNVCVGPRLHVMTLESPEIAASIEPGQFVHMKVPRMEDHILRRPFSVFSRDVDNGTVEILYQVVGFGTDHMTTLEPGLSVEMIGPVGHGWSMQARGSRALLVGGGVGAAPLFMQCEALVAGGVDVDVVLGAQTHGALVCRERYLDVFEKDGSDAGDRVRCATDDGTFGRAGFCTSLVEEALEAANAQGHPYDYVAVCGPESLMKIVSGIARSHGVPCELSMEKRMACGVGACLSCVVETTSGKRRSCVDGPVFNAEEVVW